MSDKDAEAFEAELMKEAVDGDTVAVTVLLTHGHQGLRAFLVHRIPRGVHGVVDVDDIIQEAHIEVYQHVRSFAPRGPGSFHRWVAAIALRRLRNVVRAHQALKRGGPEGIVARPAGREDSLHALLELIAGPVETPSRTAARSEAVDALEVAIAALPRHYREAVRLVYLEGRPVADVAGIMGRTPRAVHNLCHKAKEKLRRSLGSSSRFLSRS